MSCEPLRSCLVQMFHLHPKGQNAILWNSEISTACFRRQQTTRDHHIQPDRSATSCSPRSASSCNGSACHLTFCTSFTPTWTKGRLLEYAAFIFLHWHVPLVHINSHSKRCILMQSKSWKLFASKCSCNADSESCALPEMHEKRRIECLTWKHVNGRYYAYMRKPVEEERRSTETQGSLSR